MKRIDSISQLEKTKTALADKRDPSKTCITVCKGTGCSASGGAGVADRFITEIKKKKLAGKVSVRTTGCHGFCEQGPLVVVHPKGIFYNKVSDNDVSEILSKTVVGGEVIERLLYIDPATGKRIVYEKDVPFYKKQTRLLFGNNGKIDPTDIEDYVALGGYGSLGKALSKMAPGDIIDTVKGSGLRGRGGGGFSTGKKWASCQKAHGTEKYIICNADEGDPGAFQDRSLLEGNPHSVLEGMIIGAYAIGAREGYIYVRNEYPLAVKHIRVAIKQAGESGFIGKNILGSDFSFTIKVNRGGGAFVCGESSALFASIEGRLGEPRFKHVHATEKGLWDKPTVLNNVKTWATIPIVIDKGADWFARIGTDRSKGTMIFSLVGKINNTGLAEVPMGITLHKLIFDIGGGIPNGKRFKAVQTGGPSGGCIPEKLLDLQVDYEGLTEAGSMMGSGSFIIMDEDTCMVDIAKYFLSFTMDESCGKCTPCREGTMHMYNILKDITEGKATMEDLDTLEDLGRMIKETSLCQLGTSAPNPILSTLRYFKSEYEAHIKDKKCPTGVCRKLLQYSIDKEKCTGCTVCAKKCPVSAISGEKKKAHKIDKEICTKCGVCYEVCKFDAVKAG
ncbi:MAG: NADH-ubiquinone oxidoreductase-F iron-sulfur binding region domain-containing protein [Candidatus Omnitrophota bacterium]